MSNIIKVGGGGGGSSVIVPKTITQNGTYNASADSADGYNPVVVNVSGGGGITKTLEYSFDLSQGGMWINTQVNISDIDVLMFERVDNDNITMQTIVKVSDIAVYTGGQDVYSPIYRQDNRDMNARIYNNVLFVSYNGTSSASYKTNVYSLSISDYIT